MLFHRGLQHFGRQAEEVVANAAHQHHGIFNQPRDLGQKPCVFDNLKPGGKSHVGGVMPDRIGPRGRVEHDMRAGKFGLVVFKARDFDLIGRKEPVSARGVPGCDPIDGQRHNLGPGFIADDAEDRMQRADPFQTARAPPHRLGPWEVTDRLFQHFGHDLCCRAARLFDFSKEHFPFGGIAFLKLITGQTSTAQKAFDGFLGCVGFRAFAFFNLSWAGGQHIAKCQRQAARRGENGGGTIGQASLNQTIGHQLLQVFARTFLHPRRDFFGEKFNQQIWHGRPPILAAVAASHRGLG